MDKLTWQMNTNPEPCLVCEHALWLVLPPVRIRARRDDPTVFVTWWSSGRVTQERIAPSGDGVDVERLPDLPPFYPYNPSEYIQPQVVE